MVHEENIFVVMDNFQWWGKSIMAGIMGPNDFFVPLEK